MRAVATLRRVLLLVSLGGAAARRPADATPIGAVATGIGEIDRSRPFIDLMKQARGFSTLANPTDQNASAVDAVGWPAVDFAVAFMTVGGGAAGFQYPQMVCGGVYTVVAVGNATIAPSNQTTGVVVLNQTYNEASNTLTAYLEVDDSKFNGNLWLLFTDTRRTPASPLGSGLVNVSLLQPGYTLADAQEKLFTDAWLTHLARFDTLRLLGWTLNGTQTQVHWEDRPSLSSPSWLVGAYGSVGAGVPWEVIVRLANALGANLWLNIEAGIDDDYLVGLATLLNATLDPDLTVVLEYGNEMWNGHFIGHEVNMKLAVESVQNDGDPYFFARWNNSTSADDWASARYAWMTMHMADVFAGVVGKDFVGRGKRFRNVLAGQGDNPKLAAGYLAYLAQVWGTPADLVAAFTIAPYFGIDTVTNNLQTPTTDQIIQSLNASLQTYDWAWACNSSNTLAMHVALITYYGPIEFRGYESGPATTGPSYPVALMAKANATLDPRMQGLVERLYRIWYGDYGLSTVNIHQGGATTALAPWGSFGVLYDMTVPVTPKTLGVDAVRASPPGPLSAGLPLPLVGHNASLTVGYYGTPRNPVTWLPFNSTLVYLLRNGGAGAQPAPPGSKLNVTIHASCMTANALLEVSLGYGNAFVVTVPVTKSFNDFEPVSVPLFTLPDGVGFSTLQFRVITPQVYRLLTVDAVPVAPPPGGW